MPYLSPQHLAPLSLDGLEPSNAAESHLASDSAAVRIVELLVERGVTKFFGIPGGPISPIFEALRLNGQTQLVEVRHETHAAFAASSYYRLTGNMAAVLVTAGPGVTNVLTGVAAAHAEQVPMLVIAGDVAWTSHGGRFLQNCGPEGLNIEQTFASVTNAQVRVSNARSALGQALAAHDAARDPGAPGPALLVLPIDRATESTTDTSFASARVHNILAPAPGAAHWTAQLLTQAQRPLLVLGGACLRHSTTISSLVEALQIPFITTPRAKGVISEDHPLSFRNGGMAASLWARHYTGRGVDAALVLGTDLDDVSIGGTPYVSAGGHLVHVDTNPEVFNRNLDTALGVRADLRLFCDELRSLVIEEKLQNPNTASLLKDTKQHPAYDVPDFGFDRREPIPPHTALFELQQSLPSARFITDIGEHMLACLHYVKARGPGEFHIHLGLGSMGSGIAGAIGLALGDRERPVVCVCGDGGMQMSGMELLTAKKLDLPIVYAIFNDSRYNMVHHGMKQQFGDAELHDAPEMDFAAWAQSMGVPGVTIQRGGEISASLMPSALELSGPMVLDIRIDPDVRVREAGRVESLQRMSMTHLRRVEGEG